MVTGWEQYARWWDPAVLPKSEDEHAEVNAFYDALVHIEVTTPDSFAPRFLDADQQQPRAPPAERRLARVVGRLTEWRPGLGTRSSWELTMLTTERCLELPAEAAPHTTAAGRAPPGLPVAGPSQTRIPPRTLNLSGASFEQGSCHQCKRRAAVRKCEHSVIISKCRNGVDHEEMESCLRGFCSSCLERYPHMDRVNCKGPGDVWRCPSCRGVCKCRSCVRSREDGRLGYRRKRLKAGMDGSRPSPSNTCPQHTAKRKAASPAAAPAVQRAAPTLEQAPDEGRHVAPIEAEAALAPPLEPTSTAVGLRTCGVPDAPGILPAATHSSPVGVRDPTPPSTPVKEVYVRCHARCPTCEHPHIIRVCRRDTPASVVAPVPCVKCKRIFSLRVNRFASAPTAAEASSPAEAPSASDPPAGEDAPAGEDPPAVEHPPAAAAPANDPEDIDKPPPASALDTLATAVAILQQRDQASELSAIATKDAPPASAPAPVARAADGTRQAPAASTSLHPSPAADVPDTLGWSGAAHPALDFAARTAAGQETSARAPPQRALQHAIHCFKCKRRLAFSAPPVPVEITLRLACPQCHESIVLRRRQALSVNTPLAAPPTAPAAGPGSSSINSHSVIRYQFVRLIHSTTMPTPT